jgi:hypothetical protein
MPYTWTKAGPPATALTARLQSFWIYYDFVVSRTTRQITVGDGYYAVYLSQASGPPGVLKPTPDDRDFTIADTAGGTIQLKHAALIQSRLVEYSNEFNHLHVFKFDEAEDATGWIDTTGWNPAFTNPTKNEANRVFWPHTVALGTYEQKQGGAKKAGGGGKGAAASPGFTDRYVYWLMSRENAAGTRSVGMVMPFLNPSCLSHILSGDDKVMPPLKIKVQSRAEWQYFPTGVRTFPGDVKGYVMVAQGAFKATDLSSELEAWHFAGEKGTGKESLVADRLADLVHRSSEMRRTLETCDDTEHDSVIPPSPDGPVEVLYLDSLNNRNPVPSLV